VHTTEQGSYQNAQVLKGIAMSLWINFSAFIENLA
jgi:hypothetical protein